MANVLDVSYQSGGPLSTTLQQVTIQQKFGSHSLGLFDYKLVDKAEYVIPKENTPFRARWGVSPLGVRTFYGYTNHYETKIGESGSPFTRLVTLGTSKVMNTVNPSVWTATSRSSIAREIARRYRHRSIIHPHPFTMEHWATGPRTDWQALKQLADETGYRLWVDGATVMFLDPMKLLNTAASNALAFSKQDIKHIQILGGSDIPEAVEATRRSLMYGINGPDNQFFDATSGNSSEPTVLPATAVLNYANAIERQETAKRKENDYYVAQATLTGNAAVRPGSMVVLESGSVNMDQGGVWLVTEAIHSVSLTSFTTKIWAVRGVERMLLPRTVTTLRDVADSAPAVIRDGHNWEAVLQEHVNV